MFNSLKKVIIISFAIYKVYNKPHLDVLKTSPDIKVNANVLFNDFVSDENTIYQRGLAVYDSGCNFYNIFL